MMYNYPFFSFPHFRRYSPYYYNLKPQNNLSNTNLSKTRNNYSSKTSNIFNNNVNLEHSHYNNPIHSSSKSSVEKSSPITNDDSYKINNSNKRGFTGLNFLDNFLNQSDRGEDESYFEIFGLKLYSDDILLLGLIFFLYKEEVKDQYLFFALILLLLS